GLTEVEVGTGSTAVADAADGSHTACVTLAAPVHACVTERVVFGHTEEQGHDIVARTLGLGLVIPVVHAVLVAIDYGFGILSGLATRGVFGRGGGWGGTRVPWRRGRPGSMAAVSAGAADGIASVEAYE